jgi:hypothetical protein
MKKLLIACLFTITAHAELLEFTTPYYVIVDEQGNAVQSVTRSTTPENALKKIINQLPDGTYGIVLEGGRIRVVRKIDGQVAPEPEPPVEPPPVVVDPEPDPEPTPPLVCEEGFQLNGTGDACVLIPVEPEQPPHNHGNMPHVDETKNVATAIGFDSLRIRPTTRTTAVSQGGGEFRTNCPVSHMGVFDPIVYPNQARAGHHHTFFGNVTTNGFSTTDSLKASGNTTCLGGIGNRSAY